MKIVSIAEKDLHAYIAIEDFGDGTCRLYEAGDEALLEQAGTLIPPISSDSGGTMLDSSN